MWRCLETWDPLEQVAEWWLACNLHMKAVGVAACRLGDYTVHLLTYLVVVQVATRNYIQDQGAFTERYHYLLIAFPTVLLKTILP